MKIKTLLILAIATIVVSASGISAFMASTTRRTEKLNQQSLLTERLIAEFFAQSTLAQEYVAHHDERPKAQWYIVNEGLTATLSSPLFQREPSSKYREALRDDTVELKSIFDQLVRQVESPTADPSLETQIAGDLLVRISAVTRTANEMAAETTALRISTRKEADRQVFTMFFLLAMIKVAILSYLYRRIIGSLSLLQTGVRAVSKGGLNHRIYAKGTDEVSELSSAFDAMTLKLKEARDTLEQKVEERTRELHAASARNSLLLESIGDGVMVIDRQWRITLWNPSSERLTGWSEEEVRGKLFRDVVRFIREHDRRENLTFIEEAMLYGEAREMTNSTLLVRRDGTEIPVSDSAAPIFDEDGKVTGVIIVFRDATKEKEASLLRTDFAYASHQLRTPINKALWTVEMLMEECAEEEKNKLEVAHKSLKDVANMAERLLEVSRIDQGLITVSPEDVDLGSFLKRMSDEHAAAAKEQKVTLVWPEVRGSAAVHADHALFTGAVEEVIRNALMYSASGTTITIDLRSDTAGVTLQVRDQGIGIEEEQKPLVFTKFFRGRNIPDDAVGSGLGLFIAREYIRLMGGKLWFESKLGEGSTFTISLPRSFSAKAPSEA